MSGKLWSSVGHGIYCVDAGYVKPGVACCYLMVEGGEVAIIETGTALTAPTIAALLNELGLPDKSVRYIVPTHVHLDHAGGAGVLMQQYPNAELVIHPRGARHMIDPETLVEGTIAVYGEEKFRRLYGNVVGVDKSRVVAAEDGYTLNLNGRILEIRDTPGHADHHFCVWDERSRGWFSGDTFGISYRGMDLPNGRYIIPTTTPVQFNAEKLLESMALLMSYKPERFFLTHYGVVEDPPLLAKQLEEQVIAFRDMALEQEQSDEPEAAIESQMMEYVMARIVAIQPDCDQQALADLLAMDINLNAQGLAVWLKRKKKESMHAGRT